MLLGCAGRIFVSIYIVSTIPACSYSSGRPIATSLSYYRTTKPFFFCLRELVSIATRAVIVWCSRCTHYSCHGKKKTVKPSPSKLSRNIWHRGACYFVEYRSDESRSRSIEPQWSVLGVDQVFTPPRSVCLLFYVLPGSCLFILVGGDGERSLSAPVYWSLRRLIVWRSTDWLLLRSTA